MSSRENLTSASPVFGRTRDLGRLHDLWVEVVAGTGCTMHIVGEAGVGKTTLVEAFLASHVEHTLLRGWCLSEAGEPLLAIREALRGTEIATSQHHPRTDQE